MKIYLKKKLFAKWENDWNKDIRGHTFYKIGTQLTKKILYLYNKLLK